MTIEQAVANFKMFIEGSILEGGGRGKTAMIRSSVPILNLHEAVKHQLIENGIDASRVFPPVGARSPELNIAGALKRKNQDVTVIPDLTPKAEILEGGLLDGERDKYGLEFTERTICVNVRSQISSLKKNFDTLYERTLTEAQNFHDRCPKMVLGEVYMIAIPEYDDKKFDNNEVAFKAVASRHVEQYINAFQAVNDRKDIAKNFYQYEAVCLLIVDFRQDPPKIYHTTEELKRDGFLARTSTASMDSLNWEVFSANLLQIYRERFGSSGTGTGCAPTLFSLLVF